MQETQVQSLGWEAPLEKEMATHSSILAWKIPWREEPDRLESMGSQESDMTYQLSRHHHVRPRSELTSPSSASAQVFLLLILTAIKMRLGQK